MASENTHGAYNKQYANRASLSAKCLAIQNASKNGDGMLEEQGDDAVAIGLRLGRVRKILGMTRKDFAERAEVKPQVYGPIEKGERGLSLETAKKLRRAYGLSLEFMYFGKIDDLPHRIATAL